MATALMTSIGLRTFGDLGVTMHSWPITTADDVGERLEVPGAADRSVQMASGGGSGFDGSTIVIEGSNDGINYATLTDPQGNPLSFTVGKIETITEITRYIRPRTTVVGAAVNVLVTILTRRDIR